METADRPLRIEWFMLHSGYIRYFGQTIGLLAERGHSVHLAFTRIEKDPGDARLAHALADAHPNVTFGQAPLRRRGDGWRPLAGLVRGLIDLGRYVHPRYADSPALRARMARKLSEHVAHRPGDRPGHLPGDAAPDPVHGVADERAHSRRIVGALAAVERAIPTAAGIDGYLRQRRPDTVVVTPVIEFASTQVEYVKSARRAGIPSGVAIASWDNLTGKGLIRVVPDRVFVWNEVQVDEAVELHGVPRRAGGRHGRGEVRRVVRAPTALDARGAGRAGRARTGPAVRALCLLVGVHRPGRGRVRPASGSTALRADERPRSTSLGVLVRPHPQNAAQWRDADLSAVPNVAVWPRAGAQPGRGRRARRVLRLARPQRGRRRDQHQRADRGGDPRQERPRPAGAASSPARRRGRCTSATCCTRTAASCTSPRPWTSTPTSSPTSSSTATTMRSRRDGSWSRSCVPAASTGRRHRSSSASSSSCALVRPEPAHTTVGSMALRAALTPVALAAAVIGTSRVPDPRRLRPPPSPSLLELGRSLLTVRSVNVQPEEAAGVMEFRLLGQVEAVGGDGLPIALGQRPRMVLALLLLDANEVVSTDRLIEGIWGETAPPASAAGSLQVNVHALRKAIGPERIVTRSPGYAIRVEPDELDVLRFERLAEEGRRALQDGTQPEPRRASQTRSRSGEARLWPTTGTRRSRGRRPSGWRRRGSPRSKRGSRRISSSAGMRVSSPSSRRWSPSTRCASGYAVS